MFHSLIIKITFLVLSILVSFGLSQPVENVIDVATTTPAVQVKVQIPRKDENKTTTSVKFPKPEQVTTSAEVQKPVTVVIPVNISESNEIPNTKEVERAVIGVKTYSITPQEGSPLEAKTGLDVEGLRAYVLAMNPDYVAFRKKTASSTEAELIAYLEANGFKVEYK